MTGNPSRTPLQTNPAIPSNFIDPPTLAPAIIGTGIAMAVVSSGVVAARLNANLHSARKLGWDDCKSTRCCIISPELIIERHRFLHSSPSFDNRIYST